MRMIRIVLICGGVPEAEGRQAAIDIADEFNRDRSPRYVNASCRFESGKLILSCDNDGWDAEGRNLMDEFSDCLSAYVATPFGGDLRLDSAIDLSRRP